jgi:hypothetical protein
MKELLTLRAYESRMKKLSLSNASQLERAYQVHAWLNRRAITMLEAARDEWEENYVIPPPLKANRRLI